jgi:sulfatase modifying factor 1
MLWGVPLIAVLGCTSAFGEPLAGSSEERLAGQLFSSAPADDKPRACPEEMAVIGSAAGDFCIDRWEASLEVVGSAGKRTEWPGNRPVDGEDGQFVAVSVPGRKPQGYISGQQAARACEQAGKQLCAPEQWRRACRGPGDTLYPYGDRRRAARCNDRFRYLDRHPVTRLFAEQAPPGTPRTQMWSKRWMNDPRLHEMSDTVSSAGQFEGCRNDYGVYDMVGNLHEWLADPQGTFAGGFFMDTFQNGEGCEYRTRAHSVRYHDYSTGFRCCSAPRGE